MKLFPGLALAVLLASACKIERTPEEFFDNRPSVEEARVEAADEVRDRLLALGYALARGNPGEAMLALAPAPDAQVIGPGEDVSLTGAAPIATALAALARAPAAMRIEEVEVTVEPRANVAWFAGRVVVPGAGEERTLQVTGVYVREAGAWRMEQIHLSLPARAFSLLEPNPAPDSTAAPEEGGSAPAP